MNNTLQIGIGRRVSLGEWGSVVLHGIQISLPQSAKETEKEKDVKVLCNLSVPSDYIPVNIVRGGILCRIISIIQVKGGLRAEVLTLLTTLLNRNITPLLKSEANHALELIGILKGEGSCICSSGILNSMDVFQQNGIAPISLNEKEAGAFSRYPFIAMSRSCFHTYAMVSIVKYIDCIGSLSSEVLGGMSSPYDLGHFETGHQQRGIMQCATNLKLLLDNSKRMNSFNASNKPSLLTDEMEAAFYSIPQVNGPCLEAVNAAVK